MSTVLVLLRDGIYRVVVSVYTTPHHTTPPPSLLTRHSGWLVRRARGGNTYQQGWTSRHGPDRVNSYLPQTLITTPSCHCPVAGQILILTVSCLLVLSASNSLLSGRCKSYKVRNMSGQCLDHTSHSRAVSSDYNWLLSPLSSDGKAVLFSLAFLTSN